DGHVTGVQTCALPISSWGRQSRCHDQRAWQWHRDWRPHEAILHPHGAAGEPLTLPLGLVILNVEFGEEGEVGSRQRAHARLELRSEERRVGKGCRCGW